MTAPPRRPSTQNESFWKTKTLEEMSDGEWESLCDGCARCCLEKLEDEDTGKIYFTHISCTLLDASAAGASGFSSQLRGSSAKSPSTPASRHQSSAEARLSPRVWSRGMSIACRPSLDLPPPSYQAPGMQFTCMKAAR